MGVENRAHVGDFPQESVYIMLLVSLKQPRPGTLQGHGCEQ